MAYSTEHKEYEYFTIYTEIALAQEERNSLVYRLDSAIDEQDWEWASSIQEEIEELDQAIEAEIEEINASFED
jgi:hypothetical protein